MTLIALIAAISMGDIKMDLRKTPSTGKKPQESSAAAGERAVTGDITDEKDLEQGKASQEK